MDELLIRLKSSRVGCHVGHVFCGALTYADDITLLAPTHSAMSEMLRICEQFASEYHVLFNSSKSYMLLFSPRANARNNNCRPFYLNGNHINYTDKALHLGTYVGKGAHEANVKKICSDIYCKTNNLCCFQRSNIVLQM